MILHEVCEPLYVHIMMDVSYYVPLLITHCKIILYWLIGHNDASYLLQSIVFLVVVQ